MKLTKYISKLILVPIILIPSIASADTITFPALEIESFGSDDGFSVTAAELKIKATAFRIKLDAAGGFQEIPDELFTLTSTSGSFSSIDGGGYFSGDFSVNGGLLGGTFTNLLVLDLGAGLMQVVGQLIYTSGSLSTGFNTTDGLADGNLLFNTSGSVVGGKLGAVTVVPVPAAAWLFGTGLIGLVAVARRKT